MAIVPPRVNAPNVDFTSEEFEQGTFTPTETFTPVDLSQIQGLQEAGQRATQGTLQSFERGLSSIGDAAAAERQRINQQLADQTTGFADTSLRSVLGARAGLDVQAQARQAENELRNLFEQNRLQAEQVNIGALGTAGQLGLNQAQLNEQARQVEQQRLQELFQFQEGQRGQIFQQQEAQRLETAITNSNLELQSLLGNQSTEAQIQIANQANETALQRIALERELKGRELTVQEQRLIMDQETHKAQLELVNELKGLLGEGGGAGVTVDTGGNVSIGAGQPVAGGTGAVPGTTAPTLANPAGSLPVGTPIEGIPGAVAGGTFGGQQIGFMPGPMGGNFFVPNTVGVPTSTPPRNRPKRFKDKSQVNKNKAQRA